MKIWPTDRRLGWLAEVAIISHMGTLEYGDIVEQFGHELSEENLGKVFDMAKNARFSIRKGGEDD